MSNPYTVHRDDLMSVILKVLTEELAESTTKKERVNLAESIIEALDGPVLSVTFDDDDLTDDEDSSDEECYEMDEP